MKSSFTATRGGASLTTRPRGAPSSDGFITRGRLNMNTGSAISDGFITRGRGGVPVCGVGERSDSRGDSLRGRGGPRGTPVDTRGRGGDTLRGRGDSRGRSVDNRGASRGTSVDTFRGAPSRGTSGNTRGRGDPRGRSVDNRGRGRGTYTPCEVNVNGRGTAARAMSRGRGESRGQPRGGFKGPVRGGTARGPSRGGPRGTSVMGRGRGTPASKAAKPPVSLFNMNRLTVAEAAIIGKCGNWKAVSEKMTELTSHNIKLRSYPSKALFMTSVNGRGIIRSMATGKVVCSNVDITSVTLKGETLTNELPQSLIQDIKFAETIVEPLLDAVSIRLYYTGSEWLTATNNTIDASWKKANYRTTTPFSVLFAEVLEKLGVVIDYATLPKENTYCFIFTHPGYRNVLRNDTYTAKNSININNATGAPVKYTVHPKLDPTSTPVSRSMPTLIDAINKLLPGTAGVSVSVGQKIYIFKTNVFTKMECLQPKPDHSKSKSFYTDIITRMQPDPERDMYYPEHIPISQAAYDKFNIAVDRLYEFYNIMYTTPISEVISATPKAKVAAPAKPAVIVVKWKIPPNITSSSASTSTTPVPPTQTKAKKVPKGIFNSRILAKTRAIIINSQGTVDFRSACVRIFEEDIKDKTRVFEDVMEVLDTLE